MTLTMESGLPPGGTPSRWVQLSLGMGMARVGMAKVGVVWLCGSTWCCMGGEAPQEGLSCLAGGTGNQLDPHFNCS